RYVSFEEFEKSYAGIVLEFEKGEAFAAGGKTPSLLSYLVGRVRVTPRAFLTLFLSGICLLLPGFALPAFLRVLIDFYFLQGHLPWRVEFLSALLLTIFFALMLNALQQTVLNRLKTKLALYFSSDFLWHLLRLPVQFYTQRYPGEIAYRITLNE